MSAFLAHLAGIALGETAKGAARPSLPPLYARQPASDAGFDATPIETSPEGQRLAPAPAALERPPRADRPVPDGAPGAIAGAPAERRSSPKSTAPAARPRDLGSRPPVAEAQPPPATVAARPPIAPPVSPALQNIAGDPPAPATVPPSEIWIAGAAASAPPFPPPQATAPAAAAGERPLAPLSERALAGRTEPPRRADPVIHVTIDRIDVRAPAVPRPATAARRPPAEPSVSLSDFLRGGPRTRQ
jgi:hypothetical protein